MNNQYALREDQPAPTADDATATTGVPTTYMWNWSANIRANNSELCRDFHVLIFLGSVPKDPKEWTGARSYAGAFTAFVTGRCANSAPLPQDDVVTQGAVGPNRLLEQDDGLHTFDPHVVRPYLKNGLDWRIQMGDGTPVPIENLPSLEVRSLLPYLRCVMKSSLTGLVRPSFTVTSPAVGLGNAFQMKTMKRW